jgi:hypothetical protein
MTRYTFKNTSPVDNEPEEFVKDIPMDELDDYLEYNPTIKQVFTPSHFFRGKMQIDCGFRDILNRIQKTSPGNTMTIPSVKVR